MKKENDRIKPTDFERFKRLAKNLVAVPKNELKKQIEKARNKKLEAKSK